MPDFNSFLLGVALPAGIALLFAALARLGGIAVGLAPLGIGLAVAAAHVALVGWRGLPPPGVVHWPGLLAGLAGLAAGIAVGTSGRWRWFGVGLLLAVIAGGQYLTHDVAAHRGLSTGSFALLVTWWTLGIVAAAALWALPSLTRLPWAGAIALVIGAACVAVCHERLPGSTSLAQLCGALAAAIGAAGVLARWKPSPALAAGIGVAAAVILASTVSVAYETNDRPFPWPSVIALAVAPLGLFVAQAPGLASRPRLGPALGLVAVALGAGFAVAWIVLTAAPASATGY